MMATITLGAREKKFAARTITKLQVADNLYENTLDYLFAVNVIKENGLGYIIQIEIIDTKQTAKDGLSTLLADLGKINSKILFQTDFHCNMLKVINKPELLNKWRTISPELKDKYKKQKEAIALFDSLEVRLGNNDNSIETALRNRGLYDMVFNGLIGRSIPDPAFEVKKEIANFIDEKPLPFIVKNYVVETPIIDNEPQNWIRGVAHLNKEKFDQDYLRRKIRKITGNAIFPVKPEFTYEEAFRINGGNNEIIEVRQELRFIVEGYYYSLTKNIMKEIKE